MRWEYESPITERRDRLVNLDVAPGFTGRAARGRRQIRQRPLTGERYPPSLLYAGLARHPAAPGRRLAAGRRLVAGDPRADTASTATRTSISRSRCCWRSSRRSRRRSASRTTPPTPLTLANGFVAPPRRDTATRSRVDPDFRVGYAAQLAGVGAARPAGVADGDRAPTSAPAGTT